MKSWKHALPVLLALLATSAGAQNTLAVTKTIPFVDPSTVRQAVLDECGLPEKHASLLLEELNKDGITPVVDDEAVKSGKGRALVVEIMNAGGGGNAWTGRSGSVTIRGRLMEDGQEIGNFVGQRTSSGGAFGAYKGACSILGRDVQSLSKDIVKWLKSPAKDSKIGELK